MGDRLAAGQWTLDPYAEVRILVPQLIEPAHLVSRFFYAGQWDFLAIA